MSLKLIVYTLGNLLICLAGSMLFPLAVAIYYRATAGEIQNDLMAFVISAIITLIIGLILRFSIRSRQEELGIREGFCCCCIRMGNSCALWYASIPICWRISH